MTVLVSYSEIYGNNPTDKRFSELISSFNTEHTFISLAMWNLMFSLYESNFELNKYLQGFFIHNLINRDQQEQVFQKAGLESETPRPVFSRWQFLGLMKRILLESSTDGNKDPRHDDEARRELGDLNLMLSDLFFTEELSEGLKKAASDSEKMHDELMTQWLFQFELVNPPDVFQAVARNFEYFNIFDNRANEFTFSNGESLAQRFEYLTGLKIQQYLRLYFAIYISHTELLMSHPNDINENPSKINFDKERIFSLLDFNSEEREVFFQRVLIDLPSLIESVKRDASSTRMWQFDFTTFRHSPLVYNTDAKQGFTCIDFSFLIEKLASGIYHTILNSWAERDAERGSFQSYWGKTFEQFVNDRLSEAYPASVSANRLYANPYFKKKKNKSIEVSDAVLDVGDALIIMEHKGGYLSLDEKYSGEANKLLDGIANKFGLNKAIRQLSKSIRILFNINAQERDIFFECDKENHSPNHFNAEDSERIRKVYPVLIVQDFSMTMGFVNRRLKLQFKQKMQEFKLDSKIDVRPLSLLTIEDLENILEHLEEVTLTDILDEYSRKEHEPRSTFDGIFGQYLKARGIEQRRYRWSIKRCEEILDAIKERFIADV